MKSMKLFAFLLFWTVCMIELQAPVVADENDSLVVTDNGNVGIGTSTPEYKLDVNGVVRTGSLLIGKWYNNPNYVFFGTNELDQSAAGNYALLQGASGTFVGNTFLNSPSQIHFRINNTDKMFISNSGKIGIGTNDPVTPLHIYKTGVTSTSDMFRRCRFRPSR